MSEKKESVSNEKINRRSMLKWTGALAAAVAVGVGAGYETDQLLRPITTFTQTEILPVVYEEQVYSSAVGDGGTPVWVYTKGGRIIRIRPMVYSEDEAKPWSLKIGDKTFSPRKRSFLLWFDIAHRRYTYSPKRILYPMKRVGFVPGGKSDVSNRGKGEFVRITWDEALDTMAGEMKRIKATYGNAAISLTDDQTAHGQKKIVHTRNALRLLNFFGGYTRPIRNPDSWEGWYWGAEHVWGFGWNNGVQDQFDLLEDTMQNTKLLICWANDRLTTLGLSGYDQAQIIHWLDEVGIKQIYITPDLGHTAGKYADKWIPIRPNTDAALATAIANVWINEGTYMKDYVNTHGYGFDKWSAYVMGAEDGVPKTPQWAEQITGVKARVIRALAREWASKPTSVTPGQFGAACRTPYATEWPRMIILLLTMQGLGKPGVNEYAVGGGGPDPAYVVGLPSNWVTVADSNPPNPVKQTIYKTLLPGGILNPPVSWVGGTTVRGSPIEEQWLQQTYPLQGSSEVKMIWDQHPSEITNWNCGNKWIELYKSPKIEFFVSSHCIMENDVLFADLVLPVTATPFEQDDILTLTGTSYGNAVGVYMKKCIEPVGESKSEYDFYMAVAQRLGIDKQFGEGRTVEDWIKLLFNKSSLPKFISYDDFKKKGYYVFKFPDTWTRNPGLQWFYNKPNIATSKDGLITPSGKVEFYAQNLAQHFPNDKERPPVPHYIAEGPTHQESLTSARAKNYPLLVDSPHPRYRLHSRYFYVSWLNEIPTAYVYKNGLYYEPLWMHPVDAKVRGIIEGDIVRIFNERGAVLAGAHVTERMAVGAVRIPNGASYRPAEPGRNYQDTGGVINLITPYNTTSANAFGMACTGFLAQVEKWVG